MFGLLFFTILLSIALSLWADYDMVRSVWPRFRFLRTCPDCNAFHLAQINS
jgi:hypothetical protein